MIVLKFQTLFFDKKVFNKKSRPRSDCTSTLIRACTVHNFIQIMIENEINSKRFLFNILEPFMYDRTLAKSV